MSGAPRTSVQDGDPGIEILPGAVIVDLSKVDLSRLTIDELRAAFEESVAQMDDAERSLEDVLGGLDINPL